METKENLFQEIKNEEDTVFVTAKKIRMNPAFIGNITKYFQGFQVENTLVKIENNPILYVKQGSVLYLTKYGIFTERDITFKAFIDNVTVDTQGKEIENLADVVHLCHITIDKKKVIEALTTSDDLRKVNTPLERIDHIRYDFEKMKNSIYFLGEELLKNEFEINRRLFEEMHKGVNILPSNSREIHETYKNYALKALEESLFWVEKMNKINEK